MGVGFDRMCKLLEKKFAGSRAGHDPKELEFVGALAKYLEKEVARKAALFELGVSPRTESGLPDVESFTKTPQPFEHTALEFIIPSTYTRDGTKLNEYVVVTFQIQFRGKTKIFIFSHVPGQNVNDTLAYANVHEGEDAEGNSTIGVRISSLMLDPTGWIKSMVPMTEMERYGKPLILRHYKMMSAIMAPTQFVVEKQAASNSAKRKKIPRTHQRPTYTYMDLKKIRTQYNLGGTGEGGVRRGHARRAHYRTFRSERFRNMKGQQKLIPATWIGPTEARVGNKIYRVLPDI